MAVNQTKSQNGQLFLTNDLCVGNLYLEMYFLYMFLSLRIVINFKRYHRQRWRRIQVWEVGKFTWVLVAWEKRTADPYREKGYTWMYMYLSKQNRKPTWFLLSSVQVIFVNSKESDQCQTITMAFHYIRHLEVKNCNQTSVFNEYLISSWDEHFTYNV